MAKLGNIKLFNYPIKFNQVHYMRVFKSKYFRATFMVSAEITWKGAVKNGKQKMVYAKVTDAISHLLGCTNCIRLNKHGLLSEAIRAERRKKLQKSGTFWFNGGTSSFHCLSNWLSVGKVGTFSGVRNFLIGLYAPNFCFVHFTLSIEVEGWKSFGWIQSRNVKCMKSKSHE